jgi:chromosome segregation ATPase
MTSELSPARQRLAELQKTKGAAVAKMTALQSQIGKLDEIIAAISPARAALDAADHEHKAALSRWAKGEDAAQPRTSRRRRASLVDALAQAELDASAAVAARAELSTTLVVYGKKVRADQVDAEKLAKVLVVEEMRKLLHEVISSRAVADALAQRFAGARAEILRGIGFGDTRFGEAQNALEKFERQLHEADAPAKIEPNGDEWRRFTSALMSDATVSFEDAQETVLAPLPATQAALDSLTAIARGVESLATNSVGSW